MERCLSENTLVLLHSGEGSETDRAHLESCLSCARRYRRLSNQLSTIVAVLKQSPPPPAPRYRFAYSRLGWSLAAAAMALAFVCGRLTAFGVGNQGSVIIEQSSEPDSVEEGEPSIPWVEASNTGIATPASYGIYIEGLLAQDEPDQYPVVAVGNGESGWDEF